MVGQQVCLKIIRNVKEYFDQGIDEIRVLEYIQENCDVDDKNLLRLLDYFYYREHLIVVTEVCKIYIMQHSISMTIL